MKQERIPFGLESEKQTKLSRARETLDLIRLQALMNNTENLSMEEVEEEIRQCRKERKL